MKNEYRIICLDDPSEETMEFGSNLSKLKYSVATWFCEHTGEGYDSIKEFQNARKGIHQIQVRTINKNKKSRWKKLRS